MDLSKDSRKNHFPFPFIDQVLEVLAEKKCFSFLYGFSGYNQIQIILEDKYKTIFTYLWDTFSYKVLHFGLCNSHKIFHRVVLSIFSYLIHDTIEISMDDFTHYGNSFEESLTNIEKVLKRCEDMNLSLNHEKWNIIMSEDIVFCHLLSYRGIEVDQSKVKIIKKFPTPQRKIYITSFLGHAGYYRRFIKLFRKPTSPLFTFLFKDIEF